MSPTVSSDAVGVRASDDETTGKKRKKKNKDKDKERRKRKERDEDGEPDGEPKKRSKKRVRDAEADGDDNDVEPVPAAEPVEDEHPRKKRRKKKKDNEQATGAGEVDAEASIDPVLRMLSQAQGQAARDPNEEILQILQSVDISKIDVDALFKNAPSGAYYPAAQPLPADDQPGTSSSRSSSKSKSKTSKSKSKSSSSKSRAKSSTGETTSQPPPPALPVAIATSGPDIPLRTENTPENVAILTTKWLSSKKLEQMIRDEGLLVKKGKFSVIEEHAVRSAVEKYRTEHNLTEDELQDLIFAKFKRDGGSSEFWTTIALQVPQRPLVALYHWVKRVFNPLSKQGKWSGDEDTALLEAMGSLGQAWEKVSERVGRTASDCRDRWRNHLQYRDSRNVGVWTDEEEADLTRIVREMTLDQGKSADSDIFWTEVARRMENRRSRQQCRVKWTDSLNKRVKNDGETPRWTHADGVKLIYKVEALGVQHDTEINWLSLNDKDWNLWSAHQLQRRFQTMKRAVKDHEQMPLHELLDVLKTKKGLVVGDRRS